MAETTERETQMTDYNDVDYNDVDYNDVLRNPTKFCALCAAPAPDGASVVLHFTLGKEGKTRVLDIPGVICASCQQMLLEGETKGKR
jgi:hypothetical protein